MFQNITRSTAAALISIGILLFKFSSSPRQNKKLNGNCKNGMTEQQSKNGFPAALFSVVILNSLYHNKPFSFAEFPFAGPVKQQRKGHIYFMIFEKHETL